MKTNKAIKRLAKIESLIADVTKRFSASAPNVRAVFKDLNEAITRARQAVSLQVSSGSKTKATAAKLESRPAAPTQKKLVAKKAVVRTPRAKTKKRLAIKRDARKKMPGTPIPASVQAATEVASPETVAVPPALNVQADAASATE